MHWPRGDYAPLLGWLTENVYRHGRAFSPEELLMRATGSGLTVEPYLAYLPEKYTDLFPLYEGSPTRGPLNRGPRVSSAPTLPPTPTSAWRS